MTKSELASKYFPHSSAHSATTMLSRWITNCKQLLQNLEETGYRKSSRHFTMKQVAIIYDYLGEP